MQQEILKTEEFDDNYKINFEKMKLPDVRLD